MPELYTYRVKIDLLKNITIPELGITNGICSWTTEDITLGTIGILSDDWIGSIPLTTDVRRGGKYASLPRLQIKTVYSKQFSRTMIEQNIQVYGKQLSIYMIDSQENEYPAFLGTVTRIIDNLAGSQIEAEGIAKQYDSRLNREIDETGNFYPVLFGDLEYVKLIPGERGEEVQNDSTGLPFTFFCFDLDDAQDYKRIFFTSATGGALDTDEKKDAYIQEILFALGDDYGYMKGVKNTGRDIYYAITNYISSYSISSAPNEVGIILEMSQVHPTPNYDGFTESFGVPEADTSYAVIVKADNRLWADRQGFVDSFAGLYTYIDGRYIKIPQRGSSIQYFDGNSVKITSPGVEVDTVRGDTLAYDLSSAVDDDDALDENSFIAAGLGDVYAFRYRYDNIYGDRYWYSDTVAPSGDKFLVENSNSLGIKRSLRVYLDSSIKADILSLVGNAIVRVDRYNFEPVDLKLTVGLSINQRWGEEVVGYYQRDITDQEYIDFNSGIVTGTETIYGYTIPHLKNSFSNSVDGEIRLYRKTSSSNGLTNDRPNGDGYDLCDISELLNTLQDTYVDMTIWFSFSSVNASQFLVYLRPDYKPVLDGDILATYDGIQADNIFVKATGRKDENARLIKKAIDMYKYLVRHQNLKSYGYNTPVGGWGYNEPTETVDWTEIYDNGTQYGGFEYAGIPDIEIAKQYQSEVSTEQLKEELLQAMWCTGSTFNGQNGESGRYVGNEKIFPILEAFESEDNIDITYSMMDGRPKNKDMQYNDVFAEISITYAYDAAIDSGSKTISITNVENEAYRTEYVTGITDENTAYDLWNMGRALWLAYGGVKNKYPHSNQSIIKNEADAIEYIKKAYKWQGVVGDKVLKRYTSEFVLDVSQLKNQEIYQGSKINLIVPQLSPNGHKGLIEKVNPSPITGKYSIQAQMLSTEEVVLEEVNIYEGQNGFDWLEGENGVNIYEGEQ